MCKNHTFCSIKNGYNNSKIDSVARVKEQHSQSFTAWLGSIFLLHFTKVKLVESAVVESQITSHFTKVKLCVIKKRCKLTTMQL